MYSISIYFFMFNMKGILGMVKKERELKEEIMKELRKVSLKELRKFLHYFYI